MTDGIQPYIVGGERRSLSATSDRIATVYGPWDGFPVGHLFLADDHDADEAVQRALSGFERTRRLSSYQRSEILTIIMNRLREKREEFAQLITAEVGKPIAWSRVEVGRAIMTFQLAAEEAKRIGGETIPLDLSSNTSNKFGVVRRFPVGVVLCIAPFNFPLNLVAHKVAPAIAAGNAFILKPPPQAPLTSLKLAEIIERSGYPKEAFSVLPCSNDTAERLVADERIAMLSFTGSPSVGWMLKGRAGRKKVVLELGGNAGVIVDATAKVDEAVQKNVIGSFVFAGQVCIKVQRIFIHEAIYDRYRERFVAAARAVVPGNPNNADAVLGPVIDDAAAARVEAWINEAKALGADLLVGGGRNGRLIQPTVFENVPREANIACREVFGPVVTLQKYSTIQEAVEGINDSAYGLQAGIFSNNMKNVLYAFEHIRAGAVVVNDNPTFRMDNMPYGGVKESGHGREGVRYAVESMTESKLLVLETPSDQQ